MKEIIEDVKTRMNGTINSLKGNLSGLRTGRASAALLEPVQVDAYGGKMTIAQLGSVIVSDASLLVVQVWDATVVSAVEKAIQSSSLGLNPITEGNSIRVPIPPLSQERRKELSKKAAEYGENAKIALRNVRRDGIDAIKKLEKDKMISEDDMHARSDEIQKITDEHTKKIDQIVKEKEEEILKI